MDAWKAVFTGKLNKDKIIKITKTFIYSDWILRKLLTLSGIAKYTNNVRRDISVQKIKEICVELPTNLKSSFLPYLLNIIVDFETNKDPKPRSNSAINGRNDIYKSQ